MNAAAHPSRDGCTGQLSYQAATEIAVGSIAVLVLGAVAVPIVIKRMPADYFIRHPRPDHQPSGVLGLALFWLRNSAGIVLIVAGVLMLVLPGQGVLTILAGLSLLAFPGKRRLQLRLLRTPALRHAIDGMRRRAGKPPLQLDETQAA